VHLPRLSLRRLQSLQQDLKVNIERIDNSVQTVPVEAANILEKLQMYKRVLQSIIVYLEIESLGKKVFFKSRLPMPIMSTV
jgi:hypothetical protein